MNQLREWPKFDAPNVIKNSRITLFVVDGGASRRSFLRSMDRPVRHRSVYSDARAGCFVNGLPQEVHDMLHLLWTKAVHQEGYDKVEWMEFEAMLTNLVRSKSFGAR